MKIADAQNLLAKHVSSDTLLRHSLTVSVVLRHWAELLGEDDAEYWECVGLLHDLDFELHPDKHCIQVKDLLTAEKANCPGINAEFIHAVQSHGWKLCCDVEPILPMEKVLYTIDQLTGLIFACAMARPSKSVMDMELKSVTKKFKTPAFAAGCSRELIREGADMMGCELNDVIEQCIIAMRGRHEELGV